MWNAGSYVAPEIYKDEIFDKSVDAFSFGLILYEVNQGSLKLCLNTFTLWSRIMDYSLQLLLFLVIITLWTLMSFYGAFVDVWGCTTFPSQASRSGCPYDLSRRKETNNEGKIKKLSSEHERVRQSFYCFFFFGHVLLFFVMFSSNLFI